MKEVGESRARVEEVKADKKHKKLEDIRVEEIRNNPAHLDNVVREELQRDQATGEMAGGVIDVEEMPAVGNNTENLW